MKKDKISTPTMGINMKEVTKGMCVHVQTCKNETFISITMHTNKKCGKRANFLTM